MEPNGLAFNDAAERLNVIVPEFGRSLLLLHRGEAVLVDPGENMLGTLRHYGIPAAALRTVVLSSAGSLNIFELLQLGRAVTVVASEPVYAELRRQLRAYFFWDEVMLRQQLRGKIMVEQGSTRVAMQSGTAWTGWSWPSRRTRRGPCCTSTSSSA